MPMLTPASVTNEDKREAKRDIMKEIDNFITETFNKTDMESVIQKRRLTALIESRNMIAKVIHFPAMELEKIIKVVENGTGTENCTKIYG